jgi:hypothetical protein
MLMDSISVCLNTLNMSYGYRKQFEVVESLNHDIMTSF